MKKLIEDLKKTIVFIGDFDAEGRPRPFATAFLVQVDEVFLLVTAKHVVVDAYSKQVKDDKLYSFNNCLKPGVDVAYQNFAKFRKREKVKWIFHPNDEVDIAMIPFPITPEEDDVEFIEDELFVVEADLQELRDIFFLSFQPGVVFTQRISPIFRSGTISRLNHNKTYYIDAASFPGNSGSPVFTKPSPIQMGDKTTAISATGGEFIGIIGSYVPYQDIAISTQTRQPRVIFEENTGLSLVWSTDCIVEIQKTDSFKEQMKIVEAKDKNKNSQKSVKK